MNQTRLKALLKNSSYSSLPTRTGYKPAKAASSWIVYFPQQKKENKWNTFHGDPFPPWMSLAVVRSHSSILITAINLRLTESAVGPGCEPFDSWRNSKVASFIFIFSRWCPTWMCTSENENLCVPRTDVSDFGDHLECVRRKSGYSFQLDRAVCLGFPLNSRRVRVDRTRLDVLFMGIGVIVHPKWETPRAAIVLSCDGVASCMVFSLINCSSANQIRICLRHKLHTPKAVMFASYSPTTFATSAKTRRSVRWDENLRPIFKHT